MVLGMATGLSEAETFWMAFLRSLSRRGLRGVKLVISDAHRPRRHSTNPLERLNREIKRRSDGAAPLHGPGKARRPQR